jgi:uncharacterized surface protein with fasciclin (FAS1) repeats
MMSDVWETLPGLTGPAVVEMDVMTRRMVDKGIDGFEVAMQAFQATGLIDALKSPGPVTFFIPVNSAFEKFAFDHGTKLSEFSVEEQKSILANHIVKGKITFDELGGDVVKSLGGGESKAFRMGPPPGETASAETFAGKSIKYGIPVIGKRKMINDEVWVPGWSNPSGREDTAFVHDKECTNGLIHAVDKIIPP